MYDQEKCYEKLKSQNIVRPSQKILCVYTNNHII